ncbi:hypothetical protein [Streptomyces sp. 7N604]|uniref:hypothetical protein n=1 Tax=Streptomyces sp. 7N604 TaxID=3457415 RepID=UPI003FD4207C
MFSTDHELHEALTASGTFGALYAAVHASTPRLTPQAHEDRNQGSEPVAGLRFAEDMPHSGQARTRGTLVITADGTLTVRAYTTPGSRWLTALRYLGALHSIRPGADTTAPTDPATPLWSLRPHVKDRILSGSLQPADHVQAKTLTELPDTIGDVNALLAVAPDNRDACPAAWALAVGFFHVLATGTPAAQEP